MFIGGIKSNKSVCVRLNFERNLDKTPYKLLKLIQLSIPFLRRSILNSVGIYLFKVNNGNTRTVCRFHTLIWCSHCSLWISTCWVVSMLNFTVIAHKEHSIKLEIEKLCPVQENQVQFVSTMELGYSHDC